jgi:hypothetical protein
MDLEALVTDELRDETAGYQLEWFDVEASSRRPPHATVCVCTPDGEETAGSFTGDGPVDALFHGITPRPGSMRGYGTSGSTRSPPAKTRSATPRSCSRSAESSDPGKESRLTSSRQLAAHTYARYQTSYGVTSARGVATIGCDSYRFSATNWLAVNGVPSGSASTVRRT